MAEETKLDEEIPEDTTGYKVAEKVSYFEVT